MKIIRVGLDVPIATLFDYHVDDASPADVGLRVLVPFGRRRMLGVIVEVTTDTPVPRNQLRAALRILRDEPGLGPEDLRLLQFAAAYYHHPLGAVIMNALPLKLRRLGKEPRVMGYALTEAGAAVATNELPSRAMVQKQVLSRLQTEQRLTVTSLRALAPSAPAVARSLVRRGWLQPCAIGEQAQPAAAARPVSTPVIAPVLTGQQAEAAAAVCARLNVFRTWLLQGVTGSGKTEVYLRIIEEVLALGRQALVLVPEIALTPQLETLLRLRFGGVLLVTLHSGLNETQRLQNWLAAQSGRARIILGTRLAVFVPLPAPGIIIIDEEHDTSFKQMEGLRYSARDLAVTRARMANIPVVLGSATPSLETCHNARRERYGLLRLDQRINMPPPRISCVDTRGKELRHGLSPTLLEAIASRLAAAEQSLVFINRRGYAPALMCHACGWLSGCHRCSAQLVLHLRQRRLRCHHCGHQTAIPTACPDCGNTDLSPVGQGTQRVEDALVEHFPKARVLRIDRDSTRGRDIWPRMRERIQAREVDILIGTQILAKGHDFPHLSLVGVLNADSSLYSADFRAPERLFALLTQVAGRAGRGTVPGEVLIQTEFPGHPLYAALRANDTATYTEQLLQERRQAGFPPFVHQALLRSEAPKLETAMGFVEKAAAIARTLPHAVTIYDPVPASMTRLAGRERAQLLVQAGSRAELHRFLGHWLNQLSAEKSGHTRWMLDVDPLEF